MAITDNTYTGNGILDTYSFTFPYIDEADIKVSLDEVITTAYSLLNATTILFDSPPGNGVSIRIYRDTDVDSLVATFFPGSSIRSQDLNNNFLQNNYKTQEVVNQIFDSKTETIDSTETWVSTDLQIATTAAIDGRGLDQYGTIVQTTTPVGTFPIGKTWLQNDPDKTLSIWDGSTWLGVSSGGTFVNQPKVVYVDATNGDDANDGHRISRPKASIKAAINQINADATYGNGSIVVVAPGVYQEAAPIAIQKKDVSVVGTALRSCIVHPTQATETAALFQVNSGSYLANLTFTGMKASGTRGEVGSIDEDAIYGLPGTQGWNVEFYPGATIVKSPYIQNCTNFSDSEIDNTNLDAHNPAGGSGGDIDSAMTGGGLLIDGSVVDSASPLRSMVCDSYTHVGLDGPGILVTNNGYCQATSSYAFFCHYHIKCLNGGQANLAASTTDFGRYSLIVDGRSTTAIFTAALSVSAGDGDITFTIDAPTPDASWFGTATRPQPNMLVELNGITYPILSSVANGGGWDVTISRPDPVNRSNNLGLNGAVATPATASFYLRSMIASSGHTMEYVGSGTDYRALPENGGVPIEANQRVELNDGAIWTAITDHNGKFSVGDFFEVDQQLGYVTIPSGSIAFDLASDSTPQLAADLDAQSNKITSLADPTLAQDAATKNYVDTQNSTQDSVIASKVPQTSTTGSADIPSGTTAERDGSPAAGYLRFNTDESSFEGYDGSVWGAIGGGGGATGGGTDQVFYENDQTITTDYTITTNKNAMSTGPITINSGIVVTVPATSTWVVL